MISRNYQLDLLKAISIIFVLIWHLNPIQIDPETNKNVISNILSFLVYYLIYQVSFVAVPLFFIVSIYLFLSKTPNISYLKKRVRLIFTVFIFWFFIQFCVFALTAHVTLLSSPKFIAKSLVTGGPPLPLVGDSVFYFLLDLSIIIVFTFIYLNLSKIRILTYIIMFSSLAYFEIANLRDALIPYWHLENFLLYIPTTFYLLKHQEKILQYQLYYFSIYLIFSCQDLYLSIYSHHTISPYGRVSIFFGALTIVSFVLSRKFSEIKFLSLIGKYSLGIYALHKYWQYLFILFTQNSKIDIVFLGISLNLVPLGNSIIIVILTFLSVYLLRLTPLKSFV